MAIQKWPYRPYKNTLVLIVYCNVKTLSGTSSRKYLIWLVSFTLLFNIGGDFSGSTTPVRHLRQTELSIAIQAPHSAQKVHRSLTGISETPSPVNSSFLSRLFHHDQIASLKWKISEHHLLSRLAITDGSHQKIARDEYPVLHG